MEHEEFVARAEKTARNAAGVRSLARHVRLLYEDIRRLQGDDNAFLYMADVICKARKDRLDVAMMAERLRVYHHRDRKARGDKPIKRGLTPASELPAQTATPENEKSGSDEVVGGASLDAPAASASDMLRPEQEAAHHSRPTITPLPGNASPVDDQTEWAERRAITLGFTRRPGRRVVDGGG